MDALEFIREKNRSGAKMNGATARCKKRGYRLNSPKNK